MRVLPLFAILPALGYMPTTPASEAMRCGQRLITQGDATAMVRALCVEQEEFESLGYGHHPVN